MAERRGIGKAWDRVDELEKENAALTTRVKELEAKLIGINHVYHSELRMWKQAHDDYLIALQKRNEENAALTKEIKGHLEDLAKTVDERDEAVKDRDYHKMRGEEGVRLLTASNLEALDRAEAVEKERDELKFECRRWERIINRASESSEARIILAEAAVFVAFNKEKALEG